MAANPNDQTRMTKERRLDFVIRIWSWVIFTRLSCIAPPILYTSAMRIIAGQLRGRKLLPPRDRDVTRPITDRVKQATFDLLASRAMFEGGHVLDLFSGTGSLGLEALSRGASVCTFVDRDHDVIDRLQKNIDAAGVTDRSRIHRQSVPAMLWLAGAMREGPVRVAFLDPPYAMMRDDRERAAIELVIRKLLPMMEPDGVVVLRVPDKLDIAPQEGWRGPRIEDFGSMKVCYFQPAGATAEEQ